VHLLGRFRLGDREHETSYRARTHALHLHGYHGEMRLGGRAIVLEPGDCTVTPAETVSSYRLAVPGWHWCVHFWPIDHVPGDELARVPLHRHLGGQAGEVATALALATRAWEGGGARGNAALVACAAAALHGVLFAQPGPQAATTATGTRLERAAAAAAERLDAMLDQPADIPALARSLGVSQNRLAQAFQRRHRCTLLAYQLRRRMEHAQLRLLSTSDSVVRIAAEVGMPDLHHFNRRFRQVTGVSPTRARAGG